MTSHRVSTPHPLTAACLAAVIALLAACSGSDPTDYSTGGSEAATTTLSDGLWEVQGYGYIVEISGGSDDVAYLPAGNTCVQVRFDSIETFEPDGPDNAIATPTETIEAFLAVMAARYPFFDERDIDWPAEKEALRSAAGNVGTADDVADVIGEFFLRLGDGHHAIDSDFEPPADARTELGELMTELQTAMDRTTQRLGDTAGSDGTGVLTWGTIDAGVGYLRIDRLAGLSGDLTDESQDLELYQSALDEALTDLATMDRLVMDLRTNGGGADDLARHHQPVRRRTRRGDDQGGARVSGAHAPDPLGRAVCAGRVRRPCCRPGQPRHRERRRDSGRRHA
ncbi:hypothetical protein BH23ACT10_BH23ACT10_03700 [soil metagenome]